MTGTSKWVLGGAAAAALIALLWPKKTTAAASTTTLPPADAPKCWPTLSSMPPLALGENYAVAVFEWDTTKQKWVGPYWVPLAPAAIDRASLAHNAKYWAMADFTRPDVSQPYNPTGPMVTNVPGLVAGQGCTEQPVSPAGEPVACPTGLHWDEDTQGCVECPPGTHWNGSTKTCIDDETTIPLQTAVDLELTAMLEADDASKISGIAQQLRSAGYTPTIGLDNWSAAVGRNWSTQGFSDAQVRGFYKAALGNTDPIALTRAAGWLAAYGQGQAATNLLAIATVRSPAFDTARKMAAVREAAERGFDVLYGSSSALIGYVAAIEELRAMLSLNPTVVAEIRTWLLTLPQVLNSGVKGLQAYQTEIGTLNFPGDAGLQTAITSGDQNLLLQQAQLQMNHVPPRKQLSAQFTLLAAIAAGTDVKQIVPQIRSIAEQGVV